MSYRISKTFTFAAAHHLPQLAVHHKCRRPHGHNYTVTLVLQADDTGRRRVRQDYGALKDVRAVHRRLPRPPGPQHRLDRAADHGRGHRAQPVRALPRPTRLIEVVVSETSATTASYRP
jgi:hypothetical protein